MGVLANKSLDEAVQESGRMARANLLEVYGLFEEHFPIIPGHEEQAALEGIVQAVMASYLADHPDGVEHIVDALAHATALVVYQQVDSSRALAAFAALVAKFGREFIVDVSEQGAHLGILRPEPRHG